MNRTWALLTLACLGCLLWSASQLRSPSEPHAPAAAELDDFEKDVIFRIGELAKSDAPAARAFLKDLRSDPVLSVALRRGVGPSELGRFKAVLARHAAGVKAALSSAPAKEALCGTTGKTSAALASPLSAAPAPDTTCAPTPAPGTLALPPAR